ncbi:hypothetical protein Nepgr_005678 [Nepenthes gracilis]|uniref:ARID domain-containing protein n=1 Tax=Nepenthes gracilis TaxID=150966 RepID=A0AAD3XGL3_NEPGR|nr:hypothetical protein Nepgr_005678 [Nepenthes gracilis]
MMFYMQGAPKYSCRLLAVTCGRTSEDIQRQDAKANHGGYPFPQLASSGCLEIQTLSSPSIGEFHSTLESLRPNVVYLQGKWLQNYEVGPLIWGSLELSTAEVISDLFDSKLPTTVYLEIPNGEKLAEAIHSKGIPHVIFWKNSFSCYAASHFRHALFSVLQSSSCHTWDAFRLAHASYSLYCIRNNLVLPVNSHKADGKLGPCLLGDPPSIEVALTEIDAEQDEDSSDNNQSAVKIHDEDVNDAFLLECLEDGLHALLSIEIRGSKLHNRFSAPPPPLQAGTFSRGVVTMRCDISTSSAAHISLLVSGSAQTCFDDQLLENLIKKEVIERSQLENAIPTSEEKKLPLSEPRKSASIACGVAVFEVCAKLPSWALQVLRQLVPETSYRNLVALGIASIQGMAVASFDEDDAKRLLFFCTRQGIDFDLQNAYVINPPSWLRPPAPSRKWFEACQGSHPCSNNDRVSEDRASVRTAYGEDKQMRLMNGLSTPIVPARLKSRVAAMRPIPNMYLRKMMPFTGTGQADGHEGSQIKTALPAVPSAKHAVSGTNLSLYRKSSSNSYYAKQIISVNPKPLKKHGCGRAPIQICSEEKFLEDVMQFLLLRGHTRLIPQGGLAEFPDAVLNSKKLDLYNLYREVVSRGGFHVGNGINWKGQVFSKMQNFTATNKMTGVGNTLKRHYETYLLEYELAHDDVDGECCLLCHSSAAGDWVNCGICREWAHFGCDRRQGLGAFKDYAKTDGLEYVCPHCSVTNFRKKLQKRSNGFSEGLAFSPPS